MLEWEGAQAALQDDESPMAIDKRGTRTRNRTKAARRGGPPPPPPPRGRVWLKRVLVWGGALAALLLLALGTSVYFAARNMPGYTTLMNSQVGQTIVVRAKDGTEIVALGPSYGQWLRSDEIPQVMKDAMISVEDRRFHSHFGVDMPGIARALYVAGMDIHRSKIATEANRAIDVFYVRDKATKEKITDPDRGARLKTQLLAALPQR